MNKSYRDHSWISDKLEVRQSLIHGHGVFAKELLKKDETIIIWGGTVFTKEEVSEGKGKQHTLVGISENLYLGTPLEAELTIDDYMNHSCKSNVGMRDEITLVTKRDVMPNEELTADYAIWLNNEEYVMKQNCNCGYEYCRVKITGKDWQLSSVQMENLDYFSPFIKARIDKLREIR
jgi:hypothetical protein